MYLDDKPGEVVKTTSEDTMEYKIYTVDVDTHTIWIEAELSNGQRVLTRPRTFYVSKKGIGFFDALSNMEDMKLSWYYNWNTTKSNQPVVRDLDFTPMFWSGPCDPSQIAEYKQCLAVMNRITQGRLILLQQQLPAVGGPALLIPENVLVHLRLPGSMEMSLVNGFMILWNL